LGRRRKLYVINLNGEEIRLGEQQKEILDFYVKWRDFWGEPLSQPGEKRMVWGRKMIPTIWVRNRLFAPFRRPADKRHLDITASEKASFSRSLSRLEAKGLIVCENHVSGKRNYVTHYRITEKGENVLKRLTTR